MSVFFLSSRKASCELVHTGTATTERCLPWRWAHKHSNTLLSAFSGFHTDFGILLPRFTLPLPWWPRFAALGNKRKATEPQEGTTYLYLGTNIKAAWFSKKHRARQPTLTPVPEHRPKRNAEGSWFWNSWLEPLPLPSSSCYQTPRASAGIGTQSIRNMLGFFSPSFQRECQEKN